MILKRDFGSRDSSGKPSPSNEHPFRQSKRTPLGQYLKGPSTLWKPWTLTVFRAIFAQLLAFESDLLKTVWTGKRLSTRGRIEKARSKSTTMETRIVQLRTHQKNIDRYEGLLQTKLTEAERQYIEKRLSEECLAMAMLQFVSRRRGNKNESSNRIARLFL
jgi:hypothetical protein